jgi:hypothetical protein
MTDTTRNTLCRPAGGAEPEDGVALEARLAALFAGTGFGDRVAASCVAAQPEPCRLARIAAAPIRYRLEPSQSCLSGFFAGGAGGGGPGFPRCQARRRRDPGLRTDPDPAYLRFLLRAA